MSEELEDLLDDVEGPARKHREGLLDWLLKRGVTADELREAKQQDRLALLPTEHLLTRGCNLSIDDSTARTGVRREFVERAWRAAGISVPPPDEAVIDDEEDLEAMRAAKLALDAGMPEETYVEISRVVGRAAAAIAQTMVEQTSDAFVESGDDETEFAMRYAEFSDTVVPLIHALVGFPIRMHLRDTVRNQAVERTERRVEGLTGTRRMAIGFADLVGFSSLSQQAELGESSRVASRLEELSAAVAQPPVRLVKLIGDEAMLVCEEVEPLVTALAELKQRTQADEDFPSLHIGVAVGEVVPRAGDVYGPSVNEASRLADAAQEGQFLVSPPVAERLGEGFELRELEPMSLKGVGEVVPVELV